MAACRGRLNRAGKLGHQVAPHYTPMEMAKPLLLPGSCAARRMRVRRTGVGKEKRANVSSQFVASAKAVRRLFEARDSLGETIPRQRVG